MELTNLVVMVVCSLICVGCFYVILYSDNSETDSKALIFGLMNVIVIVIMVFDSLREEKVKAEVERPQNPIVEISSCPDGVYIRCEGGQLWFYNSINNTFKRIL